MCVTKLLTVAADFNSLEKPWTRTAVNNTASLFLSFLQSHPETVFIRTVFYIKFMITKDFLKKSQ